MKKQPDSIKAQLVRYTVTPGQQPEIVKIGLPSTDLGKLQRDADNRNRAVMDQHFQQEDQRQDAKPGDPEGESGEVIVTYAVEIVRPEKALKLAA